MTVTEIKKEIEGCEVMSLHLEGTVYISGGQVYRDGVILKRGVNWRTLWSEYLRGEGITAELSEINRGERSL